MVKKSLYISKLMDQNLYALVIQLQSNFMLTLRLSSAGPWDGMRENDVAGAII